MFDLICYLFSLRDGVVVLGYGHRFSQHRHVVLIQGAESGQRVNLLACSEERRRFPFHSFERGSASEVAGPIGIYIMNDNVCIVTTAVGVPEALETPSQLTLGVKQRCFTYQ